MPGFKGTFDDTDLIRIFENNLTFGEKDGVIAYFQTVLELEPTPPLTKSREEVSSLLDDLIKEVLKRFGFSDTIISLAFVFFEVLDLVADLVDQLFVPEGSIDA